jgi:replicative DNA helicase
MGPIADRLAFLSGPYSIESVADAASRFQPNIIAADYIQRFTVGDGSKEPRQQLERAATILRCFCDAGAAVLVASAVARQKSQKGSTYSGLNLASFRGSSELEYGCDSAYLFAPSEGDIVTLQCEKNRYAEPADIVTRFDRKIQSFAPAPVGLAAFGLASREEGHPCGD